MQASNRIINNRKLFNLKENWKCVSNDAKLKQLKKNSDLATIYAVMKYQEMVKREEQCFQVKTLHRLKLKCKLMPIEIVKRWKLNDRLIGRKRKVRTKNEAFEAVICRNLSSSINFQLEPTVVPVMGN